MELTIMVALLNNAALLLVLSVIYETTCSFPRRFSRLLPIINGFLIAIICTAIMAIPFTLAPGIIYDTRSILISVTALIFGLVPTVITVAVAVIHRIFIGGAGTMAGIAVILTCAAIGLSWRRWLYPKGGKWRWLNIYVMGIAVHITMLLCMLLLPDKNGITIIREIAAPVLLIYPVATVLLSLLLMRQQELRRIKFQLEQSEERFKILFEKAPLGYQSLDFDGRFIDVNQKWLDTLGYSKGEVIGRWFGDFLSPSYRDAFRGRFPIFKAQGYIHSEFEMLHKSGKPLYIVFEGKVGFGNDGSFKQTHCILQDITEQKRAEEKLRLSEEKHRRLFETMAQGVVYQAADGSIISANPAAERILGLTLEQMQGKTSAYPGWKSIKEDGYEMPGTEHPAMIALRTGKPAGPAVMGVFHPHLNDYVWLSINAIPLFEPGETKPFQVYTTFQDITAERKANQDYQLLFNEMVDAFALHELICDGHGKPVDYRFLAVNTAFENMTGLKAADILGKTVLEVLPDIEPFWIETYGRVVLTGESISFEHYTISTNKHFEVKAYKPAPNQFACTFADVTKRIRSEEDLNRVLARLRSLLVNSPSPIVIFDDKGEFVEVSAAAEKIMELAGEMTSTKVNSQIGLPEIVEKALLVLSQSADGGQYLEGIDVFEFGGNKRYFESRIFPIGVPNYNEKLFGYLGIDVTDRMVAENALKKSEEKYSSYIENAPFGVFVVDEKGNYIELNAAASLITGYNRDELLAMSIRDITAEESATSAMRHFKLLLETGHMSTELQFVHKDGSKRWWTVDAVKLSKNRFLGFSSDITDRKQADEDLIHLSYHDYLTGLYNRRYFEEEMYRLDRENILPTSVIIGDINGVKIVNDAFGHAAGDRLISESAAILNGCCRKGDIPARIGGDEFAIFLPNTDEAGARDIVCRIQAALKEYDANCTNEMFKHSVALGFGTKETAFENLGQAVKIAEEHMYRRKLLEHSSFHSAIISSIKATMFEKSIETEEHAERLVALARAVGTVLKLAQAEMDKLELLATLHDIGKVGISDGILTKPGKLNEDEWVQMRRHPEVGYRIAMTTPELAPIAEGILCHQEWWDGSGYPQGLSGEGIPLLARIVAVVDAYDAMTNDRPYREAMTHEAAIEEIRCGTGTHFDPLIAKIFIESIDDILDL